MRAAVLREIGQPLQIEEREIPVPRAGEVLVRVEACGLCHIDIHAVHGDWPMKPAVPLVPGHEAVGRVHQVGDGVEGVRVGERVAMPWLGWACGRCEACLSGSETLCLHRRNTGYDIDGGFAEYAIADARFVVEVPVGVDPLDAACLSCAGLSAYRGVLVSGSGPAHLTAVFGVGGVGHLAVQYARTVGATVTAVDRFDARLDQARTLGARHVVNVTEADPVAALQTLGGADEAIVAADSHPAMEQALASLKPGGRLVLLSMPADNGLLLPIAETVQRNITVIGSIGGSRVDLRRVFALQAKGATRVVHQARVLSQVNEAMAEVEAGKVPARLVFEFR